METLDDDDDVVWVVDIIGEILSPFLPLLLLPTFFTATANDEEAPVFVVVDDDDTGIFSNIKSRSKSFKLDHPSMSSEDSSLLVVARCFANDSNKQFT